MQTTKKAPEAGRRFRTVPGYAFARCPRLGWRDADTVVLPEAAVGCEKVYGFVTIDGARCVLFHTPAGRFAQTAVATEVK